MSFMRRFSPLVAVPLLLLASCKPRAHPTGAHLAARDVALPVETIVLAAEHFPSSAFWAANDDLFIESDAALLRFTPTQPEEPPALIRIPGGPFVTAAARREDAVAVLAVGDELSVVRGIERVRVATTSSGGHVTISDDGLVIGASQRDEPATLFYDADRALLRGRVNETLTFLSASGRYATSTQGIVSTEGDGSLVIPAPSRFFVDWLENRAIYSDESSITIGEPETRRTTRIAMPCAGRDRIDEVDRRIVRRCRDRAVIVTLSPLTKIEEPRNPSGYESDVDWSRRRFEETRSPSGKLTLTNGIHEVSVRKSDGTQVFSFESAVNRDSRVLRAIPRNGGIEFESNDGPSPPTLRIGPGTVANGERKPTATFTPVDERMRAMIPPGKSCPSGVKSVDGRAFAMFCRPELRDGRLPQNDEIVEAALDDTKAVKRTAIEPVRNEHALVAAGRTYLTEVATSDGTAAFRTIEPLTGRELARIYAWPRAVIVQFADGRIEIVGDSSFAEARIRCVDGGRLHPFAKCRKSAIVRERFRFE